MGKTTIEWTDEVWNPVTGCTKVSQGCKFCYAERVFPRPYPGRAFTDVRTHPERLDQPGKWKRPRRIFVNSMSDLFHEDVPSSFIDEVFARMVMANQHTYQILTKRPERMLDYLSIRTWEGGLPHVWLGVSVEDQETANERIPLLLRTPASVRFVSYEPALGPVDFHTAICKELGDGLTIRESMKFVDWIIAGGESGPKARPAKPWWFQSARDQCAAGGIAFLFKQWGEWAPSAPEGDVPPELCQNTMWRVGKKAAGRLLDGRLHDEYPV